MAAKLGIVAGGGALPAKLIAACRAVRRPCFIVALEGHADRAGLADAPQAWIRLGEGAKGIGLMREAGVAEVVFAGHVRRPSLAELRPDLRTARFFARVGISMLGDNGLLAAVVKEIEDEGFRVVGPETVLAPLLAVPGPYGRHVPDDVASADIARGLAVAKAIGALDIGQAAIVQQGIVLGVEAIEGTDALIARSAMLKRAGLGGVLVKAAKPSQERRIDLPTIGIDTVVNAAAAGLRGIAIEAGATLVIDSDEVARAADAAGLFVIGVAGPG